MIDLHCHTTASDGVLTPTELLALGEKMGLSAMAITDHDNVGGVEEFMSADSPLEKVPGIELSCASVTREKCHIVGLFIDYRSAAMQDTVQQLIHWRDERNEKMMQAIIDAGLPLTREEVLAVADGVIGRPHIAEVLVKNGACKSLEEAFRRFIGDGGAYYIPKYALPAEDAIRALHEAGGLAIWAHPMVRGSMTNVRFLRILDEFCQCGLDGVEAFYPDHTECKTQTVLAAAKERGLLVSGGSDFHGGKRHPKIYPGRNNEAKPMNIPDELLENMKRKLQRQ